MADSNPVFYDSSFSYTGSQPNGWLGYMNLPGASSEPSRDRVPSLREVTRAQQNRGYGSYQAYEKFAPGCGQLGFPVAIGGTAMNYQNGMFLSPPRNRYSTYRIMDLQPTLKLARKMLSWHILSSTWSYRGIDSTVPKADIKMISDMMSPLRYRFLEQALRYTSYGWRPFELIWKMRGGYHWLSRIKSLSNDLTNIIIDKGGSFAGLYQPLDQATLRVDQYEAFKVTSDSDTDNHYGISRHESAYDSWVHWQTTRLDQLRLSDKIAGIIPILKFPPGSSLINGVPTDNSDLAQQILDDIAHATGVAFQAYEWGKNELTRNPELAKISDWNIDFYDAGNLAAGQMGMIATSEYDDKQMLRAWETPERSAISADKGGSKADSEVHSDSGVSAVEMVDDDLADQFNKGPVNMVLLCNRGEEAMDKIVISPAPHVERKRVAAAAFLKLFIVDPVLRSAVIRCVDADELIDLCEVPRNKHFEITEQELQNSAGQINNGSSNPTGSSVTTGATNQSVVGRVRGSISASQIVEIKELKDQIAELYEYVKTPNED